MFGGLIKDVLGIAGDVVKVVSAPVSVAVSATRAATKPIGDAMSDVAEDVRGELVDDDKK